MAQESMQLVRQETLNGVTTRHYTYEGMTIVAESTPPSDGAIKRLASALREHDKNEDGEAA